MIGTVGARALLAPELTASVRAGDSPNAVAQRAKLRELGGRRGRRPGAVGVPGT